MTGGRVAAVVLTSLLLGGCSWLPDFFGEARFTEGFFFAVAAALDSPDFTDARALGFLVTASGGAEADPPETISG